MGTTVLKTRLSHTADLERFTSVPQGEKYSDDENVFQSWNSWSMNQLFLKDESHNFDNR